VTATHGLPSKLDQVRAMAAEGFSVSEIAHAIGETVSTVTGWAAAELILLPTRAQSRKARRHEYEARA